MTHTRLSGYHSTCDSPIVPSYASLLSVHCFEVSCFSVSVSCCHCSFRLYGPSRPVLVEGHHGASPPLQSWQPGTQPKREMDFLHEKGLSSLKLLLLLLMVLVSVFVETAVHVSFSRPPFSTCAFPQTSQQDFFVCPR